MTIVAITGGTGFVGGALARALLANGNQVRVLVRPSSNRENLAGLDVTWVEGDITQPETLEGAFAGAKWLIHAAGMLGQAGVDEQQYWQLHKQGTDHVLSAAHQAGVERVLYVSSPGVLGPISGEPADETSPRLPSNIYERSKAAAEQVALAYAKAGFPVIVVRPEFIYGPGDSHVLGLFKAVRDGRFFYIGGGHNECHPTYVGDAVNGCLRCLKQGRSGEIYHITGPEPVSFRQLAETIAAELGVPAPRLNLPKWLVWLAAAGLEGAGRLLGRTPPLSRAGVAFFSEDRRFSWEKARRQLGYEPAYDLASGVAGTVAWYREKGWL